MNIGIIGLGLIGGSLGRAISKYTDNKVYGLSLHESTMQKAELCQAIHARLTKENAKELDMLIITLYPRAIEEALDEWVPLLKKGCIVVDCGGTKRGICKKMFAMHETYPDIIFMGGHPMAGREFSGFSHSQATLFEKSTMLIVPIKTPIEALVTMKEFAQSIGFEGIVITTPEEHDEMISFTSQLAHIVSSSYIKNPLATTHYGFSAGSFRDMTRVARLNPQMWSELMLENRDYLVGQIDNLQENLSAFKKALMDNNCEELEKLLDEGRIAKEQVESLRAKKLQERINNGN